MNEMDKSVNEGVANLRPIFSTLKLSSDEQMFVDEAATKIANYSIELFQALPVERSGNLRPVVMAAAIAHIIFMPYSDFREQDA